MTTINVTTTMAVILCADCSMPFGVTEDFERKRRSDRVSFYCPAGHKQWFPGKTDEQLRREAERQAANAAEEARIARAAANKAERELRAVRKAAKTADARAKAALCPVEGCARSFVQLGRHMHAKHPDFVHEHAVGAR